MICISDLKKVFGAGQDYDSNTSDEGLWHEMLAEADIHKDGKLTYEVFR